MAKKDKLSTSDVSVDDNLEIPEMDFNGSMPKDDRKPVTKFVTGVASGATSAVFNENFVRKSIKTALPAGYGEALDFQQEVSKGAKQLYNTAASEIKPSILEMARAAEKLAPASMPRLRDKLAKLKKWAGETGSDYTGDDQQAQRDKGIESTIRDTFQYQMESDAKDQALEENRDRVQQGLDLARHRDQYGILNNISQGIQRLYKYQDQNTAAFQKKSLELQLRGYFLAIDSFEEAKKQNATANEFSANIAKNTALPDYVKISEGERIAQFTRNKFAEKAGNYLFGGKDNFVGKVVENGKRVIKDKLESAVEAFSRAAFALEEIADARETVESSGIDKTNLAGNIVGGGIINGIATKVGTRVRRNLEKNKNLVKTGLTVKNNLSNLPQISKKFKEGNSFENFDGEGEDLAKLFGGGKKVTSFAKSKAGKLLSSAINASKELVPTNTIDTKLEKDTPTDLLTATSITKQTNKSLNEIIPGYLARIFREIQVLRTGDESISLTTYDFNKNKFSKTEESDRDLINKISGLSRSGRKFSKEEERKAKAKLGPGQVLTEDQKFDKSRSGAVKDQIEELMTLVKAEQTLSKTEQLELGKLLVKSNANTDLSDAKTLSDGGHFEKMGVAPEQAAKYSSTFAKYYGVVGGVVPDTLNVQRRQSKLDDKFKRLGSSVEDSRSSIQELSNLGQSEQLERLGIINPETGEIDINKILEYNLDFSGEMMPESKGTLSNKPRRLSGNSEKLASTNKGRISSRLRPAARTSVNQSPYPDTEEPAAPPNMVSEDNFAKSIETFSSKQETTQAVSILTKIEELIAAGNTSQQEGFAALINKTSNTNVYNGSGIEISPGKFVKGLWKIGKVSASKIVSGARSAAGGAFNTIKGVAGVGLDVASKTGKIAYNKLSDVKEMFLPGETMPRITQAGIDAGQYVDGLTGKVIKKFSDIKGSVKNINSGAFILTLEDYKVSFVKSSSVGGIVKFFTTGVNAIRDATNSVMSLIPPVVGFGLSLANSLRKKVLDMLDQPTDIYIAGKKDPVMLARIMSEGGYFLKSTPTTVVSKPSKITGTIINAEGLVVLTDKELHAGIFDKKGNPISSGITKLLAIGAGLIGRGIKAARGVAAGAVKAVGGALKKAKSFAGGIVQGLVGGFVKTAEGSGGDGSGAESVSMLSKIYALLDSRLPSKTKKVFGDNDGDGLRDGSWKGKQRSYKKAVTPGAGEAAPDKKVPGERGKSIVEKLKDKYDKYREGKDAARDAADALGDRGSRSRGRGKIGRPGKLARVGRGLGKGLGGAARLGGRAAMGLGRGALGIGRGLLGAGRIGMSLLELGGLGTLASGAATAASAIGSAGVAAGGAVLSGLGTAASLAGTVLGGIGALLSSPVVLGALAIGAVGVGGYYLYKYLNSKQSKLVTYRTTQYGFGATAPKDAAKTLELEDLLKPCILYDGGIAKLSEKGFDVKKAVGLFNVSPEDAKAYDGWQKWFQFRFKPVFLTHLTALFSVDPKATLSEVDSLKPDMKISYLNLARFQEGPYDYSDKPDTTSDIRMADSKDVESAYLAAKADLDDELAGKKGEKPSVVGEAVIAGAAGAAGAIAYDAAGKPISDVTGKPMTASEKLKQQQGIISAGKTTAAGGMLTITGQSAVDRGASTIDLLEGIRMRCYGLTTMETSKVSALRKLEDLIVKQVMYDGASNATYKADNVDSLVAGGMFFGITQGSELAGAWSDWYQSRFLPVYLSYLGMIKQMTGNSAKPGIPPSLKNSQALTIANQLAATKGIWTFSKSPWANYVLGSDDSILKPYLQALNDLTKNDITQEAVIAKNGGAASTNAPVMDAKSTPPAVAAINSKAGDAANMIADPDSEPVSLNKGESGSMSVAKSAEDAPLAGGALLEGSGAKQYLSLGKNVNLNGVNPAMLKQFFGMVEEYGQLTGKTVHVESAFRSFADQQRLYDTLGDKKAAKPGSSLHEVGLAMDVTSTTLNDMESKGLMRKYGFTRPVGGEPWHMESAGIQSNISGFRNDPTAATKAIMASVGHGGGGAGTLANAPKYSRNNALATKLLTDTVPAPTAALVPTPLIKEYVPTMAGTGAPAAGATLDATGKPMIAGAPAPVMVTRNTYDSLGNITGTEDVEKTPSMSGDAAKPKTKSQMLGSTSGRIGNVGQPVAVQGRGGAMAAVVPGTAIDIKDMPKYSGGKGLGAVKDIIIAAAKAVGIDPKLLIAMGAVESNFDPMATVKNGDSSAKGLFQFVDDTWEEVTRKYGKKYGITSKTSPFDPVANSLMAAEYTKQNKASLSGVKPNMTGTDAYAAHFLGAGGATTLLKSDPSTIAANILPKPAKSNANIFYNNTTPRTVGEVYAVLDDKVKKAMQQNGAGDYSSPSTGGMVATSFKPAAATGTVVGGIVNTDAAAVPGLAMAAPTAALSTDTQARQPVDVGALVAPMPSVSGFNMTPGSSQPQPEKSDMSVAMSGMSSTLKQSLDVQTKMLDVLTVMSTKMTSQGGNMAGANGIVNASTTEPMPTAKAPTRSYYQRGAPSVNTEVPVPMTRV